MDPNHPEENQMTGPGPCEAFKRGNLEGYRTCRDCGHPYWVHSHEYEPHRHGTGNDGRARHKLITIEQASEKWWQYSLGDDPYSDFRPRYQIMQERRVSISKFYLTAAQHHIHRTRENHALARRQRNLLSIIELDQAAQALDRSQMIVCRTCGNKRCPRATNSENPCSGSNEPGQPGSRYANATKEQDWNF
jgi:hypothetical protein